MTAVNFKKSKKRFFLGHERKSALVVLDPPNMQIPTDGNSSVQKGVDCAGDNADVGERF